jgi:NAD(P)-dependent dehydrogenase (short-subunit alcohol dehydrogenase family)
MSLDGAAVVVTGAGGGIGAALTRRLAREGARLVVNDVDADAAAKVADEVGGLAVPGDAADAASVVQLVAAARRHFGEVDLFCANAGVAPAGAPDAPEEMWARAWDVNVMAHVRAARALLPGWLARGRGHFLATVSAAGLLTMLGSAPYSVTKHASLAFAEWMAVTYADSGVKVQALCPQGVRTAMLDASGEVARRVLADDALNPDELAEAAVLGLAESRFLILPHPEVADYYAARAADPDRWQSGMRKLARRVAEPT